MPAKVRSKIDVSTLTQQDIASFLSCNRYEMRCKALVVGVLLSGKTVVEKSELKSWMKESQEYLHQSLRKLGSYDFVTKELVRQGPKFGQGAFEYTIEYLPRIEDDAGADQESPGRKSVG